MVLNNDLYVFVYFMFLGVHRLHKLGLDVKRTRRILVYVVMMNCLIYVDTWSTRDQFLAEKHYSRYRFNYV